MYQRYYKQKKFGRFFGFFLVVGSGVFHFAKTNVKKVFDVFSLKNLIKIENFLPERTRVITDTIHENLKTHHKIDSFENKRTNLEMESNFYIYSKNLDQLNTIRSINTLSRKHEKDKIESLQKKEETIINYKEYNSKIKKSWIEKELERENIYYYSKIKEKFLKIKNHHKNYKND